MKRILVIEDDESAQDFYKQFFESLYPSEFTWQLAKTGESGLKILKDASQRPCDLLLLDWLLPGLSGQDVLRSVRSDPALRSLPVVVVTSLDEEREAAAAQSAGADDYLVKPVFPDELRARLRKALAARGKG